VSKEKDILQIRKYLNGELDARAMHEMEKRALDDPFLADALEGFGQTASDQQHNLGELTGRMQQRIAPKERRIIPWMNMSIAALVLLALGAGIWFFNSKPAADKTIRVAQVIKPERAAPDTLTTLAPVAAVTSAGDTNQVKLKQASPRTSSGKNTRVATQQLAAIAADKAPVPSEPENNSMAEIEEIYKPKKDSIAANEVAVMDMKKQSQSLKEVAGKPRHPDAVDALVQSRVDGVSVTSSKTITGTVIGSDGLPITGATVKVMGRNFGVITDAKGKFALSDVSGDQTIAVNFIGYSPKKIKINNKDSLNINLVPTNNSLSEVVVAGYGTVKKDDETGSTEAHPKEGWAALNNYLKKNAQLPDGSTGKVRLSFMVAADGSLSQFKIIKSLSDAADKKAVDLITNGPAWIGGTDRKPKEVKISVKFK
jgi:hypothetical protein